MASSFVNSTDGGFADPLARPGGFSEVDPWSESATPTRIASPGSAIAVAPAVPDVGQAATTNGFSALDAFIGELQLLRQRQATVLGRTRTRVWDNADAKSAQRIRQ